MKKNKRMRYNKKNKSIAKEYLIANKLIFLSLIFILTLGFTAGAINAAFLKETAKEEANNYIIEFVNALKTKNVDSNLFVGEIITSNIKTVLRPWVMGLIIMGGPVIYIDLLFEGYALGFTITTIINTLGILKGLLFVLLGILPKMVILIPLIIMIAIIGIKFSMQIFAHKRSKYDFKSEILKYAIVLLISLILAIAISFFEAYICGNVIKFMVKVFL